MLLSDAVAALILALLLPLLRLPALRWLFVLLTAVGLYAAARHLGVHSTLFRLGHVLKLGDPLLLRASVFDLGVLLLPLYFILPWLLLWADRRLSPQPLRAGGIVAAVLGVTVYAFVVPGLTMPANSALLGTVAQLPERLLRVPAAAPVEERMPIEWTDAGRPFFELRRNPLRSAPPPNILLILVEGLSAANLPSVARYHGLQPATRVEGLEETLERHDFRVWRNVLSMQRQTDRGTYALLCGDYPRLGQGITKMEEIASGEANTDCLPELLADVGYDTAYFQAAPLSFMRKDEFMPAIGFQRAHGEDFFGETGEADWGVQDERFFARAGEWLVKRNGSDGPWFTTLLNVGTHHPYPAGQDAREGEAPPPDAVKDRLDETSDRSIAFAAMAEALAGMLDQLEADGVLDDTVVLIGSDEAGPGLRPSAEALPLDSNFGFFALRIPDRLRAAPLAERDALVAGLDIAVTLADFAGLEDASPLMGRSVLAHEGAAPRSLMVGDTYNGQVFFLREAGEVLVCGEALMRCTNWRFEPARLFATLAEQPEAEPFLEPMQRRRLIGVTGAIGAQPAQRR